jgi:predicted metal-dependent peptidase
MLATNSAYNALKNNNKLDEFVKNFDKSLGSHKEWFSEEFSQESIESFSEVHKEMIRQTLEVLDDFTEGNETMRGYISSNIRELIKPKPRTTTINYKAYLTKKIKTFLNKNKRQTYTRLNRRYDDAKGRKKANIDKRVLVAIDTSASMVSETIAELGGVLQHIIQTTGFEVWYTTYSIGVQEPIRVTSKWIEGIGCTERGGTSVDNVFQYLIDTGKIEMFPNIIVLTDGYDVYPTSFNRIPERHKPDVLFYITSNGGSTDYPGVVFRKNDIVKR